MNKSVRDGIVTGAPTILVMNALLELGVGQAVATLCAALAGFLAPFVYRLLRARFPAAFSFDQPT